MNEAEYINEICALRARLSEIEAEMVRMGRDHTVRLQVRDEEETNLRARLAEVEAERDAQRSLVKKLAEGSLEHAARLAAVLALCDEWHGGPWSEAIGVSALLAELDSAARGEGDRPAGPCRHDGSNGTCAECRLAHLFGDGDQ